MIRSSTPVHTTRLGPLTAAVVALWFLASLVLSLTGVFNSRTRPPLALASFALVPVIIFAIAYLGWGQFRAFALSANPALLTLAQTWRIAGIVFVILYYRNQLPGVFALPAGWGDIFIGITAPFVAWAMSKAIIPKPAILLWNALGLLDLANAVILGVLSSASPLGILAHGITTELMGRFPLSLIPTFLVPLFFIFHLITIGIVRQSSRPMLNHEGHEAHEEARGNIARLSAITIIGG